MQVEGQDGGRSSLPLSGDGAYDVVALAASAGGLAALTRVLAAVPADLPAAIETGVVDFVLPLNEIAGAIVSLVRSEHVR